MTQPKGSWDLGNLSDESDNEADNVDILNKESDTFANLFNGGNEKGKILLSAQILYKHELFL